MCVIAISVSCRLLRRLSALHNGGSIPNSGEFSLNTNFRDNLFPMFSKVCCETKFTKMSASSINSDSCVEWEGHGRIVFGYVVLVETKQINTKMMTLSKFKSISSFTQCNTNNGRNHFRHFPRTVGELLPEQTRTNNSFWSTLTTDYFNHI